MSATALTIPPGAQIVLPPHGFVHLQEYVASDLDVVNAARVSFAKQSEGRWIRTCGCEENDPACDHLPDHLPTDEDEKVLRFLLKGKHGTPFEHNFFKWHIRAPIFVFREWHRHRIGVSINEESARYSPLAGDFYLPERDAIRHQVGKPGHYTFERMEDDMQAEWVLNWMKAAYETAYETYEALMERGVAKEIARAVLPVGIYSQMIWTCNARSLMNFLALRNSPHALHEIKVYAEGMEKKFAEVMPITHEAFVANGRVAP